MTFKTLGMMHFCTSCMVGLRHEVVIVRLGFTSFASRTQTKVLQQTMHMRSFVRLHMLPWSAVCLVRKQTSAATLYRHPRPIQPPSTLQVNYALPTILVTTCCKCGLDPSHERIRVQMCAPVFGLVPQIVVVGLKRGCNDLLFPCAPQDPGHLKRRGGDCIAFRAFLSLSLFCFLCVVCSSGLDTTAQLSNQTSRLYTQPTDTGPMCAPVFGLVPTVVASA